MPSRTVLASLALTLIQTASAAQSPHEPPESCVMPTSIEDGVRQRSDAELRQLYLRCAFVSEQRRLDDNEAASCSVAAETLLKRAFADDFDAMLAWLREHLAVLRAAAGMDAATRNVEAAAAR